jgi:hypothetical protein
MGYPSGDSGLKKRPVDIESVNDKDGYMVRSHLADKLASLDGNLGAPTSPATMRSILPNQSDTVTVPAEDRFALSARPAATMT